MHWGRGRASGQQRPLQVSGPSFAYLQLKPPTEGKNVFLDPCVKCSCIACSRLAPATLSTRMRPLLPGRSGQQGCPPQLAACSSCRTCSLLLSGDLEATVTLSQLWISPQQQLNGALGSLVGQALTSPCSQRVLWGLLRSHILHILIPGGLPSPVTSVVCRAAQTISKPACVCSPARKPSQWAQSPGWGPCVFSGLLLLVLALQMVPELVSSRLVRPRGWGHPGPFHFFPHSNAC